MRKPIWALMQKLDDGWYYFGRDDDTIGAFTGQQKALRLAKSWNEGWLVQRFLPVSGTQPAGDTTIYAVFRPSGFPLRNDRDPVVTSCLEEAQAKCPEGHSVVEYTLAL